MAGLGELRERFGIVSFAVDLPGFSAESFARLMADPWNGSRTIGA